MKRWIFAVGILLGVSAETAAAGFTLSGATVTLTGATQLSTNGDALLSHGSLIADTSQIIVGGSWSVTTASFLAGSSTVTFNATATGRRITTGGFPFAHVVFSGPGGYWTLQD